MCCLCCSLRTLANVAYVCASVVLVVVATCVFGVMDGDNMAMNGTRQPPHTSMVDHTMFFTVTRCQMRNDNYGTTTRADLFIVAFTFVAVSQSCSHEAD